MKKTIILLQALVIAALLAALLDGPLARMHARTEPVHDALYQTIQSLDTQIFDAYNRCDLEKFGSMLADDLEFYHDKTGLARTGKAMGEGGKKKNFRKEKRGLV